MAFTWCCLLNPGRILYVPDSLITSTASIIVSCDTCEAANIFLVCNGSSANAEACAIFDRKKRREYMLLRQCKKV
jgi:hypothetical protein